jgi:galactokinase
MSIAIILAAGKGTRMRSDLPKPIVRFKGEPIVGHIIESFKKAGVKDIELIVGYGAEQVKEKIGDGVKYVYQQEQKGTAHAVSQVPVTNDILKSNVFVFVGDSPLITAETIRKLESHHIKTGASCTFLTAMFPIDLPYARVIRDANGKLVACIEEKNAMPEQLKVRELLSSHFIFKGEDLFKYLNEIKPDKGNGELYLTDIIGIMLAKGEKVETLQIDDYRELVGLNTPEDIAWAEAAGKSNTPTLEELIEVNRQNFVKHFSATPAFAAYAPGRINIIGEHTDYTLGLSMPCAINRWAVVSMSPNNSKQVKVVSVDFKDKMSFELGQEYEPKNSWEKYIYGCILLFTQKHQLTGFNAVIAGNVPIGSGVSSSAALEVAFMNALNQLSGAGMDDLSLIKLCQQVEHQYLHVKSGLLDQYASQFSVAGKVMLLDFQKLSHQYVSADMKDYVWVLCDTKVKRSLSGSKYSERVEETQSALTTIKEKDKSVKGFRDIEEKHIGLIENHVQQKRIRHYVTEDNRVVEAMNAIENNDMKALGKLITASHNSLKNDYEVSCEELDFLVEEALKTGYCLGSRMMGGGFGGCTINLVKKDKANEFGEQIGKAYKQRFGIDAEINIYQSVNGAGIFTY